MKEVGGWMMPEVDKYFEKFIPKDAKILPKQNGFQREHLDAALQFVTRWKVAVDVGAHVGFWTCDMARRFETVYCFEPAPDTYECLVHNTKDLPNVKTYPFAAGASAGQVMVMKEQRREQGGNTGARYVMPTDVGPVRMITIDSLDLVTCDFLKIDVEGFEFEVLKGAKKTLSRHKPVIIMECDKRFAGRYGHSRFAAQNHLTSLGYLEVAHMRPDKVFVFPR